MRQTISRRRAQAGIGVAVSGLAATTACGSVAAATEPGAQAASGRAGVRCRGVLGALPPVMTSRVFVWRAVTLWPDGEPAEIVIWGYSGD